MNLRNLRIILMLAVIPFASRIGSYAPVAWAGVHGVWASFTLSESDAAFRHETAKLDELQTSLSEPEPHDWRATMIEPAQSFARYVGSDPITITKERDKLYVLPLGEFTDREMQIVEMSCEHLGLYFSCPSLLMPAIDDAVISESARRIHAVTREEQFLTTEILRDILPEHLPDDAIALLALTATDVWPGNNWNFVFGQASLKDRVGVWSLARLGNPEGSLAEFTTVLRRALKIASHETGHMFSLPHCLYYECNMGGRGSREEGDRAPMHLCPECLAKVHWSTRAEPVKRMEALAEFCQLANLETEFAYYKQALLQLRTVNGTHTETDAIASTKQSE